MKPEQKILAGVLNRRCVDDVLHEVLNLMCDGEICSIGIIIDKNDLVEG